MLILKWKKLKVDCQLQDKYYY